MAHSVLLVDDEKNILLTLSQALQLAGYHTELAGTGWGWRWHWPVRWTRS
jgi:DNA-binding NtrC family response regulator